MTASIDDARLRGRQTTIIAELRLLDTTPGEGDLAAEAEIAGIVAEAVAATGMACGTVNLLDGSRQCQVSTLGFTGADSPREESLCAEVTGWAPDVYAFADLTEEPGFTGNPWVDGRRARVRAYASAPLVVDGTTVGTLCVFDEQPRTLPLSACDRLGELAGVLSRLLEGRRATLPA
jgi:GAF domain-containing protein